MTKIITNAFTSDNVITAMEDVSLCSARVVIVKTVSVYFESVHLVPFKMVSLG